MEKILFNDLRNSDYSKFEWTISTLMRGKTQNDDFYFNCMCIAYVLYISKVHNVEIEKLKETKEKDLIEYIFGNIEFVYQTVILDSENYEIVKTLDNTFSNNVLLAYILFNKNLNARMADSTPSCISKLANKFLQIKDGESILELCSGQGNYMVELYNENDTVYYRGIELNYKNKQIADVRSKILKFGLMTELYDALDYNDNQQYDKLFAHYPFGLKDSYFYNDKSKDFLFSRGISEVHGKNISWDWLYNLKVVEQMKQDGKAVVITSNGACWNTSDKKIRKYFIENGYIETIVALPSNLFYDTQISTNLLVLSKTKKDHIRMIDAQNLYQKERRNNVITDSDIEQIVKMLDESNEHSVLVEYEELAKNDYVLNVARYLTNVPSFENGIEFGEIITDINRGTQIKADEFDKYKSSDSTQYRYLMLANISDGVVDLGDGQYLSEVPKGFEKYEIKNNSIVLSKIGSPDYKSAVVSVKNGTNVYAHGNLFVINLDEAKVNPYYIQAFFASEMGVAMFKKIQTGNAMPTISIEAIKKMIIPLPSLEEQKKIADKYAAALDELYVLKNKISKVTSRLKNVFDEEEV